MPTITSVELGASGRNIDMGSPAVLDDMATMTVLTYCRPTGSGGGTFGYVYCKSTNPRFAVFHNSGSPQWICGATSTGTASSPQRIGPANSAVYNSWQHAAFTWTRGLNSTSMKLFVGVGVDLAELTTASGISGTTALVSDAATDVFLINRNDTAREFVGDVAYIAVWDRILTLSEMINAQNNGPLDEPTGLVLLWANQADLGPNTFTPDARSTFVAGTIPPNTALGGSSTDDTTGSSAGAATATGLSAAEKAAIGSVAGAAVATGLAEADGASTGAAAGAAAVAGQGAADIAALGTAAGAAVVAGLAPAIVIDDDFEGASVNVPLSSVVGAGDDAVITIYPRPIESEVVGSARWWTFRAKVTGVNGIRPIFVLDRYNVGVGEYWPPDWHTTRRIWFSYDQISWTQFSAAPTVGANTISYRHGSAFSGDTVYVAYTRPMMPSQVATWLAGLEAAHPTLISPTPSADSSFVADTFSPQTDELGNTVPAQDFLAFRIMDASLTPPAGQMKYTMALTTMVHGAEDVADWVYRHAIQFLLSSNSVAQELRRYFDIYCYPTMNPVGRASGHWRGSHEDGTGGADDLNRHFSDGTPPIEIVAIPRAVILADLPAKIHVGLDFHGQWTNNYGYFNITANAVHDAFIATLDTYVDTLTDLGDSISGSVAAWFSSTLNAELGFTVETSEQIPLSDGETQYWGESIMSAVNDLRIAGAFPPIYDSAVGTAAGAAVVAGPSAAEAAALGSVAGAASVAGISAAEAAALGSAAGAAEVTGLAAAEEATGNAAGSAVVAGQGAADIGAEGEADGLASVAGQAAADAAALGSAAGAAAVSGVGGIADEGTGAAAGAAAVSGLSAAEKGAVGSAAGAAVVTGLAEAAAVEPLAKWPVRRTVAIRDQRMTVEITS